MVEAFQLSHAVTALHDLNILASLQRPATASALARKHGLDVALLRGVLEYAAARTDVLRKSGDRFVTTPGYSDAARFLIDMYAGAYRRSATQLPQLMRDPALAPRTVDGRRHARAFAGLGTLALGAMPALIRQLKFSHLLDLGCGTAALLIELATRDRAFVGWGLEINPAMCAVARRRLRAAGAEKRVRVLEGDCTRLRAALPADVVAAVRTVTAGDVANAMFGAGPARVIAWLRSLREVLPGRLLLISDYYGCLGRTKRRANRETLLHDYAQIISGQGVPPASAREWRTIYGRTECQLVHVFEDPATTRFVHLLKL